MSLPLRNWRRGAQSRRPDSTAPTDLRILSRPGRTLVNARREKTNASSLLSRQGVRTATANWPLEATGPSRPADAWPTGTQPAGARQADLATPTSL